MARTIFCYKGKLNGKEHNFKIDTGSDVSILNKKFVGEEERLVKIRDSFLRYPSGEKVPVEYKIEVEFLLLGNSL